MPICPRVRIVFMAKEKEREGENLKKKKTNLTTKGGGKEKGGGLDPSFGEKKREGREERGQWPIFGSGLPPLKTPHCEREKVGELGQTSKGGGEGGTLR